MITHIEGRLDEKNPAFAVIDCQGVGFMINITLPTYSHLPDVGANCRLYTYLSIKEDSHTLFGFYSDYEREIFRLLISVSGIGTGTARMMLSAIPAEELSGHIASGNTDVVCSVKGVGAKTAQRVIMELKDKMQKLGYEAPNSVPVDNKPAEEALSALVQLGFAKPAAVKAVQAAQKSCGGSASVEDLIRMALKML